MNHFQEILILSINTIILYSIFTESIVLIPTNLLSLTFVNRINSINTKQISIKNENRKYGSIEIIVFFNHTKNKQFELS